MDLVGAGAVLTQLQALEGTKIELDATPTSRWPRPCSMVGRGAIRGATGLRSSGGPRFRAGISVKDNFNFWFDLRDTEGFRNRDAVRYEVRSFADLAPRVVIDEPKSDRDVPAEATIPVRVDARR